MSQIKQTDDDGENRKDEKKLLQYTIVITFAFLVLHLVRFSLEKHLDDYLQPACFALFRDVTLLSFVLCFSIILEYKDMFQD